MARSPIEHAQKARISQSLDKPVRLDSGEVISKRLWIERMRRQGGVLKTFREHRYEAEDKVNREIERLGRNVPFGNPNHPETRAYEAQKAKLKASLDKERQMVETPDGILHELKSQAEIDYFNGLEAPLPPTPARKVIALSDEDE
jgi:hypothetical protein